MRTATVEPSARRGAAAPGHVGRRTTFGRWGVPLPKCARVGAALGYADRNLVSFGDDVVDVVMHVGADVAYPFDDVLEPIEAVLVFGDSRVIENVRCHKFVHDF